VHVGHLGMSGTTEVELDGVAKAALEGDDPKVLVTVTSSPIDAAEPMIEEYLDDAIYALNELEVSAIVTVPRSIETECTPAPHVLLTSFVPHDAVIPKCDVVVANGGWGTVARTLSAGIPSVLVPLFLDQPANAEICDELGVSKAIDYDDLDDEVLAAGITEVIAKGPEMRAVVGEIATEFEGLGGAPEAARRIAALI
jgi:N-glycosyltransferase